MTSCANCPIPDPPARVQAEARQPPAKRSKTGLFCVEQKLGRRKKGASGFQHTAMSLVFDEYGRPFIILREQQAQNRLKGLEAQKVRRESCMLCAAKAMMPASLFHPHHHAAAPVRERPSQCVSPLLNVHACTVPVCGFRSTVRRHLLAAREILAFPHVPSLQQPPSSRHWPPFLSSTHMMP